LGKFEGSKEGFERMKNLKEGRLWRKEGLERRKDLKEGRF
jgi:hypothetical protein